MSIELPESPIGGFRAVEAIGEGGMGRVFRAVGPDGQEVALKLIRRANTNADLLRRFEREARVRLTHPNVVRVVDAGSQDGSPYIAFELLAGESLAERLLRGTLEAGEVIEVGTQACRGLAAAHAAGVVHRDIKPANLFWCADGTIKLLDFGVALLDSNETRLTQTGGVVGTLGYFSPEQANGTDVIDARTDIWSLGAVLYECATGRPPFREQSALATVVAVLMSDPLPMTALAPRTPPGLAWVIDKALAKSKEGRWHSATEMGEALAAVDVLETGRAGEAPEGIARGEDRIVAVVLARDVRDEPKVARAIEAQQGVVLRLAGHRIVGIFGARTTVGDELERAALAATSAHAHAGRVAVGAGRAASTGMGISGPALDATERALDSAVDGVAVEPTAARELTGAFQLRPITADAWELRQRLPTSGPGETTNAVTAIVGRATERARIQRAIRDAVEEAEPSLILITGAQGMGKSLLCDDAYRTLASLVAPHRIASARALPRRQGLAFGLWEQLLRDQVGDGPTGALFERAGSADPGRVAAHITALEILLGRSEGPNGEDDVSETARTDLQLAGDRLRLAITDWFIGLCAHGPTALLLEDLQWADEPSLALLEEILDRTADSPIVVIATSRTDLRDTRPSLLLGRTTEHVALRGLGRAEALELVAHLSSGRLPEPVGRAVFERAGGNPFFVEQLVRHLEESSVAGNGGEAPDWSALTPEALPLPLTIEAAIQSRLDHLPPLEKDACKRASVYGRPFTLAELQAVGVEAPEALVRALRKRELVAPSGGRGDDKLYQLRSGLFVEVGYRMLSADVRRELHGKVAERLSGYAVVPHEEAADNYHEAGRGAEATEHYRLATLAALKRGDSGTVLRCTDTALALEPPAETRFELHMARADALRFMGQRQRQGAELEAALAQATSDASRCLVLGEQCVWLARAGRSAEAIARGAEAVAAGREGAPPEHLVLALGRACLASLQAGQGEDARAALTEAAELSAREAPSLGHLIDEWRAQLASASGDLGARRDAFARLVTHHREHGDVRRAATAEVNLADVFNRLGEYGRALEALEAAREGCARVGNHTAEGYTLLNMAYAHTMLGNATNAALALDGAEELAKRLHEPKLITLVLVYRARAWLAQGRAREAKSLALDAATRAEEAGMPAVRAAALCLMAQAALGLDDIQEALTHSAAALDLRDELGGLEEDEAEVFLTRTRALQASGDGDAARAVLERGRTRLTEIAAGITDPALRTSFLESHPAHVALNAPAGA